MTYKEYFEKLNDMLNDFRDDNLSITDVIKHITKLNERANSGDNPILKNFLANPAEQTQRILSAKAFEKELDDQHESSASYEPEPSISYQDPETDTSY